MDKRISMRFSPVFRWHTLSFAERPDKRVRVFVAEQVCGFSQFQNRVTEVVARHLVPGVIEQALKGRAGLLQLALQTSGTHMQVARDIFDIRAVARKPLLDCSADHLNEAVLVRWCSLLQLLFKLGCKHVEQLSIPSNERKL